MNDLPVFLSNCRRRTINTLHPATKFVYPIAFWLNAVLFFVLSQSIMKNNSQFLFYGVDGKYEVTLIEKFKYYAPSRFGFTADVLRGLGNVIFPVNPLWFPAYSLSFQSSCVYNNFALTYTIVGTELFFAVYIACRLLRLPRPVGVACGWLLPTLLLPYFGFALVPNTVASFPHYGSVLSLVVIACAMLLRLGEISWWATLGTGAFIFALLSLVVIAAPTLLVLAAPMLGIFSLISCLGAANRAAVVRKIAAFIIMIICAAFLGYLQFVAGLLLYTAADFFPGLSYRPATITDISLLFWSGFPVSRWLIGGGIGGALILGIFSTGLPRRAAIAVIVLETMFLATGFAHKAWPFWYGPAPWYFEGWLLPWLCLMSVAAMGVMVTFGLALLPSRLAVVLQSRSACTASVIVVAGFATALILMIGTRGSAGPFYLPYPEKETVITGILSEQISFARNDRFRGRAFDALGRSIDSPDFQRWIFENFFAAESTGNLHRGPGLWQGGIPTIEEYSPLITPASFAFFRRFFTKPGDIQVRDLVNMRRINVRHLAAIGVRFLITDVALDPALGLQLKASESISTQGAIRQAIADPDMFTDFKILLYEIPDPNLGQYSPTHLVEANAAADILDRLADPLFDPKQTIVVSESIVGPLVPASLISLSLSRGVLRLRAHSDGQSILLLPFEFSRCWKPDSASKVKLLRANLVETGVLFQGDIDLAMDYYTGPFERSSCRLEDRSDAEHLQLKKVFQRDLEYQP